MCLRIDFQSYVKQIYVYIYIWNLKCDNRGETAIKPFPFQRSY